MKNFLDLTQVIFEEYENIEEKDKVAINDFILMELEKREVPNANEIMEQIVFTVDAISDNYEEIQKFKKENKTRKEWFGEKLQEIFTENDIKDTAEVTAEIKNSLAKANVQLSDKIFETENSYQSEPLNNPKYEGINKGIIRDNILKELNNNAILSMMPSQKEEETTKPQEQIEVKMAKQFYETILNSEVEKNFKKLVASVVVIDKEINKNPELQEINTSQIASIVDNNLSKSKIIYKVGQGEITNLQGMETMIDKEVSTAGVAIKQAASKVGARVGARIGQAIGSVFGVGGTVVGEKIGTVVGMLAGYVAGDVIHEGLKKITPVVVQTIKTAGNWAKETINNFAQKASNFFNKIFS